MFIDGAGSTVFYREEKFYVSKDFENYDGKDHDNFVLQTRTDNRMTNHNIASLKWLLGELLFDRLKTTN